MKKRVFIFILFFVSTVFTYTAKSETPDRFITASLYGNTYPSTLNKNVKNNKATQKTSAMANTSSMPPVGNRRVVKRTTKARTATPAPTRAEKPAPQTGTTPRRVVARKNVKARGTTNTAPKATTARAGARTVAPRKVVARSAVGVNRTRSGRTNRTTSNTITNSAQKYPKLPSSQCFANYKECMDSYCERKDTAYNRCYCGARLAQIDSKYQNKIDSLIQQIIKLKYNTDATDSDIKSYWDATIGSYSGTNPWVSIDNALNINWADTESRVRGQNAFNTGHNYCVNFLRSCSYMASNLRDAYKSEIERDCTTYEKGLERIQMAAEGVIESYSE